jgi:hypothetical protein
LLAWKSMGCIVMPKGGARPAKRKVNVRRYFQVKELDARTLEGKTERRALRELTAHLGGNPTFPQEVLIRRAARLLVMIELMEKRLIESDEMSDFASRQILAWVNTLRRTLEALGLQRPQQVPKKLADVLKVKAA